MISPYREDVRQFPAGCHDHDAAQMIARPEGDACRGVNGVGNAKTFSDLGEVAMPRNYHR